MANETKPPAPMPAPAQAQPMSNLRSVAAARELFWQNVIREFLTSLSIISSSQTKAAHGAIVPGDKPVPKQDLFDGRLAIITQLGQRIPIASVSPLFACGIQTSEADKALSMAVECTVFQVHTPGGEVYTLPLHEIRSFHSLSEELIDQMRQAASDQAGETGEEPFGFAAYTSLARTKLPSEALQWTPDITGPGL